jgi:hypothetical protein
MKKLRSLHLYLGCIFAPLLLFFAISGIWQMIGINSRTLAMLSTIHTSKALKVGTYSSPALRFVVILMAASFVLTTILGVIMALKYGTSRRTAIYCLIVGILLPVGIILVSIISR